MILEENHKKRGGFGSLSKHSRRALVDYLLKLILTLHFNIQSESLGKYLNGLKCKEGLTYDCVKKSLYFICKLTVDEGDSLKYNHVKSHHGNSMRFWVSLPFLSFLFCLQSSIFPGTQTNINIQTSAL